MTVSRRVALAGLISAGGAVAQVGSSSSASTVVPQERQRLSALALGIRGDDTAADTDRAQRAIEEAARQFRTIHFEGQHEWVFRTSLTLFGSEDYGSSALLGEGAYSTVIRCSDPTKPVLVNDTSVNDFRRLSIRGLTIRGGRRGLSIRRSGEEVASLIDLADVRFEFQKEIGLHCDQYLISCFFDGVVFYYCNRGIYTGRNANNVLFQKCRFEGLNGRAAEFASPGGSINGCEDVRFVSPRFEAQNEEPASGAFVIGGYRLSTLTVDGGYFENTHATILHERGGLGQVVFRNCHFTGQAGTRGQFRREAFDSDSLVTLEGNRFVTGTDGARHMLVAGVNRGLARNRFGCFSEFGPSLRYVGAAVAIRAASTPLLRVSWAGWSSPEDRRNATMNAEVRVSIQSGEGGLSGSLLRCEMVVAGGTNGRLRAQLSPLTPGNAGFEIAINDLGDEGLLVVLVSGGGGDRTAIAAVDAIVSAPFEPPFMIE